MTEKDELAQQVVYLETKYANMKRRYESQKSKMDTIYRNPFRFLLARWYHKYIKRDQIV